VKADVTKGIRGEAVPVLGQNGGDGRIIPKNRFPLLCRKAAAPREVGTGA